MTHFRPALLQLDSRDLPDVAPAAVFSYQVPETPALTSIQKSRATSYEIYETFFIQSQLTSIASQVDALAKQANSYIEPRNVLSALLKLQSADLVVAKTTYNDYYSKVDAYKKANADYPVNGAKYNTLMVMIHEGFRLQGVCDGIQSQINTTTRSIQEYSNRITSCDDAARALLVEAQRLVYRHQAIVAGIDARP